MAASRARRCGRSRPGHAVRGSDPVRGPGRRPRCGWWRRACPGGGRSPHHTTPRQPFQYRGLQQEVRTCSLWRSSTSSARKSSTKRLLPVNAVTNPATSACPRSDRAASCSPAAHPSEDQALPQPLIEPPRQVRPGHETRPQAGHVQLGGQQHIPLRRGSPDRAAAAAQSMVTCRLTASSHPSCGDTSIVAPGRYPGAAWNRRGLPQERPEGFGVPEAPPPSGAGHRCPARGRPRPAAPSCPMRPPKIPPAGHFQVTPGPGRTS